MKQLTVLSLHEIEHTQGTVKLISDNPSLQRRKGYVLVPQPNLADENDPLVRHISFPRSNTERSLTS